MRSARSHGKRSTAVALDMNRAFGNSCQPWRKAIHPCNARNRSSSASFASSSGYSFSSTAPRSSSDLEPKANDPIKTPVQLSGAITQPATASCLARPVILLLLSFSVGLASLQLCAATPFEWEYTGSLKAARFHHTATLLPDGRVLVVGGEQGHEPLASAELYDPATGTWSDTGSLKTARDSHTAT